MVSAIKAPTLADLRAFMAVAEHRSFRRAADLMGLTPSALSHTLRALETTLNTRLLHRTTRSVSLTEAGEQLLQRIAPLLGQLNEALEDVSGDGGRVTGTLRINGNAGAISLLLRTVVPTFLQRYPEVQLDLVAEGRLVDIVEHGFDAGIRLAEAVPKDMMRYRWSRPCASLPWPRRPTCISIRRRRCRTTLHVTAASASACPVASATGGSSVGMDRKPPSTYRAH